MSFETGEPHTGVELTQALGTLVSQGAAFLAPWPDVAFFARQGESWSPAEHIRHLRKATTPLVTALRLPRLLLAMRFGSHTAPSRSFAQIRTLYQARLAAGATAGRYTPRPESAPRDRSDRRNEIMAAWAGATVALTNEIPRWSEEALDRYQLPHPLLGRLTIREMLGFCVYHTAHHLRRVAERSGVA
jgi:DinB superfamily